MPGRLENRVAIITGGANGLGRATAELFSREGARVVIADILSEMGEEVAQGIRDEGGRAVFRQVDVTSEADAKQMVETAVSEFGQLDVLMCNPAIQIEKTIPETTEQEWDRVIDLNLKGPFLCSKHALIQMQEQGGGNIIMISSLSGIVSNAKQASYNASKHGLIGLCKCIAHDHALEGIRANVVCPGSMKDTAMTAGIPKEHAAPFLKANLLERWAAPAEIANCVLFLASDESSFVTGAVLIADGGYTTK
jgi:NAD(P)-dependent dehydrogenase (short-subunit alcohol dehydrogenase family)